MGYSFMSAASKSARELHLEKMRSRNLKQSRRGRPRRIIDPEPTPEPILTKSVAPKALRHESRAYPQISDIQPSFRGSIGAFQRQPKERGKTAL